MQQTLEMVVIVVGEGQIWFVWVFVILHLLERN